jgi:glycosyltransferase involved in cell wall biosynthesis
VPLVIAGDIYPFSYHQQYFEHELATRLAWPAVRFVARPAFEEKLSLLRNARALLITSLIDETSSLVAMEAMACGTPVIGFRRGAIPEVIADGEAGFAVDSAEEMAEAIAMTSSIGPRACRMRAEARFSAERMARDYEELYQRILATTVPASSARAMAP